MAIKLYKAAAAGVPSVTRTVQTSSFSVGASDKGTLIEYTGAAAGTATFAAAATLGAGW